MSEILVLVDHVDGTVRKTTNELLTIARRLGEPSAVFIGSLADGGAPPVDALAVLKKYGATRKPDSRCVTDTRASFSRWAISSSCFASPLVKVRICDRRAGVRSDTIR